MTGFLRNGYCEVPAADFGNHSVAGESQPPLFPNLQYRCRVSELYIPLHSTINEVGRTQAKQFAE